jgi:DNA-binding response OmpR family regulator
MRWLLVSLPVSGTAPCDQTNDAGSPVRSPATRVRCGRDGHAPKTKAPLARSSPSHVCHKRKVVPGPSPCYPNPVVKAKILVVDDEPEAVELVEFNLAQAGFEVISASNGAEAVRKAHAALPSLIVLDLMLPEIDGLEVCKMLRRDPATAGIPIVMLTAKAAEIDRILGLELGADDYITKPFSPRELTLRIKKILLRTSGATDDAGLIKFGDLIIDGPRHLVSYRKRRIELTATEFKLLSLLVQRRGRVQSREQLLRDVWEYNSLIDTRTVDTHMRRLRDKLGPAAKFLDTVRGVGYRFAEAQTAPA